jgi:hypothetical protein
LVAATCAVAVVTVDGHGWPRRLVLISYIYHEVAVTLLSSI